MVVSLFVFICCLFDKIDGFLNVNKNMSINSRNQFCSISSSCVTVLQFTNWKDSIQMKIYVIIITNYRCKKWMQITNKYKILLTCNLVPGWDISYNFFIPTLKKHLRQQFKIIISINNGSQRCSNLGMAIFLNLY